MGSISFQLPDSLPAGAKPAIDRARFAGGYDRTPFPTRTHVSGQQLKLTRSQCESGFVNVPWPIPEFGFPVTSTTTLRERPEPYHLLVELARGKLNQLRNQMYEWKLLGLIPSEAVNADLRTATASFARAVLNQRTPEADADATACLELCYRIADAVAHEYCRAAMDTRLTRGRLPTRLSCRLSEIPSPEAKAMYQATFNAVQLVPNWAEIESSPSNSDWSKFDAMLDWAESNGIRTSIGPIIDLTGKMLPAWLSESKGELPSIAAYFCDFLETIVHRYRDRVKNWTVCTGFNQCDDLELTEDDRLRLVVRLLESSRMADPDGQWTVGLSLPWGDYLEREEYTYSPLVFADTLLRSGLPVNGFELEYFCGNDARASFLRDSIELGRLLELFGLLGVPLDVVARHPGRSTAMATKAGSGEMPVFSRYWKGLDTTESQCDWGSTVASIVLSTPHIRTFCWDRWQDRTNDDSLGLIDATATAKPLLESLRQLRTKYL